jgi:hypothetical protein
VRRLLAVLALSVLGAGASACDLSPPAATVQGARISRSQLDAELSAVAHSPYAQCALELRGENLPATLSGAGDDTVSSQLASAVLSTLVLERLVDQRLRQLGHPVTPADLRNARADLTAQLTPATAGTSPCPGGVAGGPLIDRLPATFRSEEVRFLAAQERLAVTLGHLDLSTPALLAYYRSHQSEFQELCLSDIAVSSESQAQSIRSAITSGMTTFASEAEQSSLDSQTAADGGQIPCLPASEVVNSSILSAISGLSPGQVSEPVFEDTSASGGPGGVWFLLEVDSRPVIPFAQSQARIRQQLLSAQNASVAAEFSRLAKAAKVTVDPRYGSWSPSAGIVPPPAPPAADLLSRTADTPGTTGGTGG